MHALVAYQKGKLLKTCVNANAIRCFVQQLDTPDYLCDPDYSYTVGQLIRVLSIQHKRYGEYAGILGYRYTHQLNTQLGMVRGHLMM